ncbi:hypothetical protein BBO99_00005060 [Phytophthora kernoviae]|uniref:Uncharacterized protein n=1 Tax=Phytophthora kernoviae TaxID=325452 RepID=A0A421F742_9STRA|nr:hypothetical protein BBI17_004289 [Phytophthora kernoviae]RLN79707.1 hypothetical protein BBO99_00005060 [Phytophthora kernoviae]
MLSIVGIAESASVALVIFIGHVATLTLLSGCSLYYAVQHPNIFTANMQTEFPDVNVAGHFVSGNMLTGIFYGYSSAMLGITGFETSAQFVEEQAPGVFRKTLRNMWVFATCYNLLLSFLSLAVLPLQGIYADENVVLATMGRVVAGKWLESWVSVDAFVVLAGGVLTSYVGITGLVRRLAFDRVLPAFLTHTNKWRGTNHNIILLFFGLQASLVILLNADSTALAGVFTFAFLSVMALFAFGCILLKLKREDIPRDVHAPWWSCIFGLIMVLLGLLGNLLGDPAIFTYFALYFVVFAATMFIMLERVFILRILLYIMQQLFPSRGSRDGAVEDVEAVKSQVKVKDGARTGAKGGRTITAVLQEIHLPAIVFFVKVANLSVLNKAILYVRKNEQTHNLHVVHVSEDAELDNEEDSSAEVTEADVQRRQQERENVEDLREMTRIFDLTYPKLKIDFVHVCGAHFDSAFVHWLSDELSVPPNMMFIRQPGTKNIHQRSALRPRTLFASICPVLISVSLLRKSHHISFLQIDVAAAMSFAILTQLMGNLSAVYTNFHRSLQLKRDGDSDAKIVLNLLSLTQVRRWSFLFYALQLLVLGIAHALCDKSVATTEEEWSACAEKDNQMLKSTRMEWIDGRVYIVELPSREYGH